MAISAFASGVGAGAAGLAAHRREGRSGGPVSDPAGTMRGMAVTVGEVRAVALGLPRTTEHLVRDRIKFRVGRLVYTAFSRDETLLGFGYPKEERDALIAAEPDKFRLPPTSDLRYNWIVARMSELAPEEMREYVIDAWRMCVPRKISALVP